MKKLAFLLLALFPFLAFADNIYCPATVTCQNYVCKDLPAGWHTDYRMVLNIPNGTYKFNSAIGNKDGSVRQCNYYLPNAQNGNIGITTEQPIVPNRTATGNAWLEQASDMTDHCNTSNANSCPFRVQASK